MNKEENTTVWIVVIILILLLLFGGFGMMGFTNHSYRMMSYNYPGFGFMGIFMVLLFILGVLAIVWFVRQLQDDKQATMPRKRK